MGEIDLDIINWFSNRELKYKPKHFTNAKTILTNESLFWIVHTLRGRYAILEVETIVDDVFIHSSNNFQIKIPSFEDPQETIFYELKWS